MSVRDGSLTAKIPASARDPQPLHSNPQPEPFTLASMAQSFHVTTFGCQMNGHDSERMRGMLASLGYEEAESREGPCWSSFNPCPSPQSTPSRFIAHLGEAKR